MRNALFGEEGKVGDDMILHLLINNILSVY
jgi:hypothetical protein